MVHIQLGVFLEALHSLCTGCVCQHLQMQDVHHAVYAYLANNLLMHNSNKAGRYR